METARLLNYYQACPPRPPRNNPPKLKTFIGVDQLGQGFNNISQGAIELEFQKRKALLSHLTVMWTLEGDREKNPNEGSMAILKSLLTS